jgi:hypothetical protein
MKNPANAPKPATTEADELARKIRPQATATVDPVGPRSASSREHVIKVVLELSQGKPDASLEQTRALAHKAFEGFAPAPGEVDRRTFNELSASRRGKGGVLNVAVVAVEAAVTWPERPSSEAIELVSATLTREGYRVSVRERRECSQPGCSSDAMIDWRQASGVPGAWFSASICGKHNFKQCAKCKSIYNLTSTNAAGQSPSVHCEVCGNVLIEWGSSKRWDAELVTRGEWAQAAPAAAPTPAK